jgi:ankyrin repeat protein
MLPSHLADLMKGHNLDILLLLFVRYICFLLVVLLVLMAIDNFGDEHANGGVDLEGAADFLKAADAGDISVLQQMSHRTELLEAQDEMGNTALHLAALNAHVRCLIKEQLAIRSSFSGFLISKDVLPCL